MPYPAGNDPWGVLAADLDGDGAIDLVTANRMDDDVTVLRGLGGGVFGPPVSYPANNAPKHVGWGEFDGDCIMDLAVSNGSSGGYVSILPGDGVGGFGSPEPFLSGASPAGLIAVDINADLRSDLSFVNTVQDNVWVLMNNGAAACSLWSVRRSTDPSLVRSVPVHAWASAAPFDDDLGVLTDGETYYYVVEYDVQLPVKLSLHKNGPGDTVRLGFNDGNPLSAPVDVVLSSVSVEPAAIPADGDSTSQVTVVPRDTGGILLGSGLNLSVDPNALVPGVLAGPIQDEGNGLYRFEVSSTSPGIGTAVVTVEGLILASQPNITYQAP